MTHLVVQHGVLAVFVLLALDAVLPVGGELPMLLSGVVAAGALGSGTAVFGLPIAAGVASYVVLAGTGTLGYTTGSVLGWAIGRRGGRRLIERHGRWLHLGPARMLRAERWFARFGPAAVLLGRVTPLVRSFVSVAAGVLEAPFALYLVLTVVGGAIWCFGLAGIGWAVGENWHSAHRYAHTASLAVAAVVAVGVAALVIRLRRRPA